MNNIAIKQFLSWLRRYQSFHRSLFINALLLSLIIHWFNPSHITIILRSLRQAIRNAKLDEYNIHRSISGSSFVPNVPFSLAFSSTVTTQNYYWIHSLFRNRERKIKKINRRLPDLLRFSTMDDASERYIFDPSIDKTSFESFNTTKVDLSSSSKETIKPEQPLYITIGPPCSGKTTWIRKQIDQTETGSNRHKILDICIDDQPGVYLRVPINYVLPETQFPDNDQNRTNRQQFLSNIVYGRSIHERMQDSSELRAVLFRFANITTKDDFKKSALAPVVVEVVEDIINDFESKQQPLILPSTVDLFVMDAIFRRPPPVSKPNSTNRNVDDAVSLSALERTEQLLFETPTSTSIAYGNTNTRPTDYAKALQVALELKRPVYFVVYYDDENINTNHDIFDLIVEDGVQGLIRRNMYRFLQTGRYVPEQVITDMRDRTHTMIQDVIKQHQMVAANSEFHSGLQNATMTKLELHQHLARMAGFVMNNERIITSTLHSAHDIRGRKQYTAKPYRPIIKSNVASRQRPWDRTASAARGYNGQLHNLHPKQNGKVNNNNPF